MTLTTHAIVGGAAGAAVAAATASPWGLVGGFAAGFASHFVIDAIPHWAEGRFVLRSLRITQHGRVERDFIIGKDFLWDLAYLGSESLLGLLVAWGWFSFGFFHFSMWAVFWGAVGGLLPDALQFVYFKTHARLLTALQNFHEDLQQEHVEWFYLGTDAWTILAALALLKLVA